MTPKYSHKTTVSLYRFDSEENYWSWLNANKKSPSGEYHDVMALVKNESLNGGYDLFINGHSLTKSRIWIKTIKGGIKDAFEEDAFSPSKQYLLKNFSRNGQGQKNVILLEEFDINRLVSETTNDFINTTFRDWMDNYLNKYLEDFLDNYIEENFTEKVNAIIQKAFDDYTKLHTVEHSHIYGALQDTHYNFRKIFSLLHHRKPAKLKLDASYVDRDGNTRQNLGLYIKTASIHTFHYNIIGAEGLDITYKALNVYMNRNYDEPVLTIDGEELAQSPSGEKEFNMFLESDTEFEAILEYTNRYLDDREIEDESKYDSAVEYHTEDISTIAYTKFYVVQEPQEANNETTAYLFYVEMEEDETGTLVLKSPYNETEDVETVHWLMNNALPKIDGEVSVFLYSDGSTILTYKDDGKVLTNDSNTGEYVYPKTDIYAMGYSFNPSSNTFTETFFTVPGKSDTYYKVYLIVPSTTTKTVKYDDINGTVTSEETYEDKQYKVYKNTMNSLGTSTIKVSIENVSIEN